MFSRITESRDNPECTPVSPCLGAFDEDVIAGLSRVRDLVRDYQYKIAAVNLSLTDEQPNIRECSFSAYSGPIEELRRLGVATVIASGNEAYLDAVNAPACVAAAVTVAASKRQGIEPDTDYSNISPLVDLLAPGTGILSASIDGYIHGTGTYMAAPHIAGLFALLRTRVPYATVDQIEAAIRNTAREVIDLRTNTKLYFPDGEKALAELQKTAFLNEPARRDELRLANGMPVRYILPADRIIVIPERTVLLDLPTQEIVRRVKESLGFQTQVDTREDGRFVAQNDSGYDLEALQELLLHLGNDTQIFKSRIKVVQ